MDENATVYAGDGSDGRIYQISSATENAVWIDIDERQVAAFDLLGAKPYVLSSDMASVYEVSASPSRDGVWTSKVLDADFISRWGQLTWRAKGKLQFQTRSGNTEKPDATWSDWSSSLRSPGPVRSAAARFVQVRALFKDDPNAILRAVELYYLPENQRSVVTDIEVAEASNSKKKSEKGKAPLLSPKSSALSPLVQIKWKVDNPDDDELRYRLSFRSENNGIWRDLHDRSEILRKTEFVWDTQSIPDGFYQVRIEASDELANPEKLMRKSYADSDPILIDNHAPRILELKVISGTKFSGKAVDTVGPIAALSYAIDGRTWIPFFPVDDFLDTKEERFSVSLPKLEAGSHIVAVRVEDAAGNVATAESYFSVGK
ncbi:MAG: hypothetical protein IPJ88_07490 [Myxococcales bacterium]|nr:MAG: hypothetical protein IPJ88_07490 [Myxococcales bacterium]